MADDTDLPVPLEQARTYIRVRPADESLNPETVATHVRRLHQLPQQRHSAGIKLFDRPSPPTIECLLISEGAGEASLTYLFGVNEPEATDTLERVLRGLFPDSYELTRTTRTAEEIRAHGSNPDSTNETDDASDCIAAVEYEGCVERPRDWQTRLTPFSEFEAGESNQNQSQSKTHTRIPLAAIIETMAASDCSIIYQTLLRPKPDWTAAADVRRKALETSQDTLGGKLSTAVFGPPDDDLPIPHSDEARLDELAVRETHRSFDVNARIAILSHGEDTSTAATAIAHELASAFAPVGRTSYELTGRVRRGHEASHLLTAICERTFYAPTYTQFSNRLPWRTPQSRAIVADATEVANFFAVDANALTAAGVRAVAPTPGERTPLAQPPKELLARYRGQGLLLGTPLTQDGTEATEPLTLPPSLQSLHVGWFGKTGAGKTTSANNAILHNHSATSGADIIIEPKGDGMAVDYLTAHFARFGTLDNVIYFDCAEVLPAFSFFDIRDELDAGVSRTTAVEDTVDHYIEILSQIMGTDRFEQAVRSPDIIRYLTKAMFDPVSGHDAFSHRDLHTAVRQMHERQVAPAVSDADLERMLAGVVANRARSFDEIMQGVANRIEKIPLDRRLARIFNHVAVDDPDTPVFDLARYLNDDVVIIFDTGDLRSEAQRVLTLVILSNLWTALRRRSKRTPDGELPLVNVYIEEAASVAVSDLLKQLLAQSRSFGCSLTLSMQFPAQLRAYGDDVYDEVLNNISTFITGNVPVDRRLAERLATDDMDAQAIGNRLRALRRGKWLVRLPAGFDHPEPRPFLVKSAALPPGDPSGDHPFTAAQQEAFEGALTRCRERTIADYGLTLTLPSTATSDEGGAETSNETDVDSDTKTETAASDDGSSLPQQRVDSALPYTNRMPPTVRYSDSIHALFCTDCYNRYDPTIEGMQRAIACCFSLRDIDRDDVPICEINLKLTPEERAVSGYTDTQLLFLQAVYNAQQLRYTPLEYDLLHDSMLRLQEYVGIESAAVESLIDDGLLRHDTDHPHRLYSVTPDGRSEIGESYRQGVDYGHGAGDLEESSQHVLAIEVARQYLVEAYLEDPESPVVDVIPYYDIDDRRRLDIAGLGADGTIVVAVEAERVNHDIRRAVPEDFDKIADCNVDDAIWVVMTQSAGHAVLQALNDPLEGDPRVEKTYANTTPPQQFRIETPGLTAMYPVEWLRDQLSESNRGGF
ncbi:ATP-binding protein [Haloprofundus sp. MHR1]|uniref:ATP-binding protein n=1 Tax=Haloprofundus sp. MHR1 TaxID=2572921 RepID=UPI0010BECDA6|nr:TraM recognition domain-containing protein [Haloprofundus sp. MHR1]QCJ45873.1 ATP-binding protein [Haloprofundus sp. MHR1]